MGACCLCAIVFRIALGILNTVILLVGLLIAGVGGVLLGLASNLMIPLILQGIIFAILKNLNLVDRTTLDNIETNNLTDLLQPAGTVLVVVGLIIAAIGALGYFGLSISIILKIYAIAIVALVVAEIIIVSLFFSGALNSSMRSAANSSLVDHYIDIYDAGIYSMIWNVIMIEMKCCGLDNYKDFHYAKNPYPKNDTIKVDGQLIPVVLETPLTCCKANGSYPKLMFVDNYCAVHPTGNISNYETGCWNEVFAILTQPLAVVISSLIIIAQAAIAVMVLIIVREEDSSVGPL